MATLGVLVASVAHEINTPEPSQRPHLNGRSRRLSTSRLQGDTSIPVDDIVSLRALISAACTRARGLDRRQKEVEPARRYEVKLPSGPPAVSSTSPTWTRSRRGACLRVPSFFSLAESFAGIAQARTSRRPAPQDRRDHPRAQVLRVTDTERGLDSGQRLGGHRAGAAGQPSEAQGQGLTDHDPDCKVSHQRAAPGGRT
jgi:hypothetical protein